MLIENYKITTEISPLRPQKNIEKGENTQNIDKNVAFMRLHICVCVIITINSKTYIYTKRERAHITGIFY